MISKCKCKCLQCSTTIVYFGKKLWPELGIWQLLPLIFYYQQYKLGMVNARRCLDSYVDQAAINVNKERVQSFVKQVEKRRSEYLEDLIKNDQRRRSIVRSSGSKK